MVTMRWSLHVILLARGPYTFLIKNSNLIKVHLERLLVPSLIVLSHSWDHRVSQASNYSTLGLRESLSEGSPLNFDGLYFSSAEGRTPLVVRASRLLFYRFQIASSRRIIMRLILLYTSDPIIPQRTHRLLALSVIDTDGYGRPRTCLDGSRSILEVLGVVWVLSRSCSHAWAVSNELDQVLVGHFFILEHTLQFLA
jgi:hypothetical protein